ncbi:hypothetical protein IWX90DRAFT_100487 [Phyllosticta citrichinensis]|uniref:Uncharacterized protein n=1 Tax=Phyllosticta citrichinensis TaxID=1130410 RepID=A0ABR1Y1S6_9PEZI
MGHPQWKRASHRSQVVETTAILEIWKAEILEARRDERSSRCKVARCRQKPANRGRLKASLRANEIQLRLLQVFSLPKRRSHPSSIGNIRRQMCSTLLQAVGRHREPAQSLLTIGHDLSTKYSKRMTEKQFGFKKLPSKLPLVQETRRGSIRPGTSVPLQRLLLCSKLSSTLQRQLAAAAKHRESMNNRIHVGDGEPASRKQSRR